MERKAVSGIMLTLLLIGMLTLTFNVAHSQEVRDLAVVNITLSSGEVFVGENVTINIYFENKGTVSEAVFGVEVRVDEVFQDGVWFLGVDFDPGEVWNYNFTWNTSNTSPGNYTVTAEIPAVQGEINTANNMATTFIYLEVTITLTNRTWTVDDDGPADFHTIQEAINAASSGDAIYVKVGTYYENVTVDKTVRLVGENREGTIIDGGGTGDVLTVIAHDVVIEGFTIRNGYFGIDVSSRWNLENLTVQNNIVVNNTWGMVFSSSHDFKIVGNTLINNYKAIRDAGTYTKVAGNNITKNMIGIDVGAHAEVVGNNVTNNGYGIDLSGNYAEVAGNNVTNNGHGIRVWSNNNTIVRNNLLDNEYGIVLIDFNNTLRYNQMTNNKYNFAVAPIIKKYKFYVNDVDVSNTVNGKPIYYWVNKQDMTVPSDAGYVALVNCTNIRVENLNLTNNGEGLLLAFTKNSTITKNTITDNRGAIELFNSSYNNVHGNVIADNWENYIYLDYSSYNNIWNHFLTPGAIIIKFSTFNNIYGNTIMNGWAGIELLGSSNNTVHRNTSANNYYGILLEYSSNNLIYHNNFINNTEQACILPKFYRTYYNNSWDKGYPSGGNFWSDYVDVDLYSGPYQNETGSDGIGDTPYFIDEDNQDNYPLMEPWSPKPPSPMEATRELIETIETWNLSKGVQNSLTSKLDNVIHLLDKENKKGATHKLMVFIKQVETLKGKKLTSEQADYLIAEAQRIINLISE